MGKTYSKPSSGHISGGRRPGQTHKKPRDLSVYDREDRGCGEGSVYMCERVSKGQGGCGLARTISDVIYT